jgi:peroxiredoxin Q/BCP
MAILVGALAPDFTLHGWSNQRVSEFTLSEQLGRPVVLAFYPSDEGLVCTRQLCSYSDDLSESGMRGATVWGISPQGVESHRAFADGHELRMPLLSDTSRAVAREYGILGPVGLRRSVFVIDADGRVAWRRVTALSMTFPTAAEVRTAVSQCTAKAA